MSSHRHTVTLIYTSLLFLSISTLSRSFKDNVVNLNVDEKGVVVLDDKSFIYAVNNHKYIMVLFYAPWSQPCKSLAPEYTAAAKQLKADGVDVVLAKVDATQANELARRHGVEGFPTVYLFVDGERKAYIGQPTKESIVTWIKKKTGVGVYNVTTTEEAKKILTSNEKVVLAYLNSLIGHESDALASASRFEDDVTFFQTVEPNVAKQFGFDKKTKCPALVLLKKDIEKISYYDGQFTKSAILEFVFANKRPLVTTFISENAFSILESGIKKQLLLFATSNDSERVLPTFTEAAKNFKGKIIFVYVKLDDDTGKTVAEYFGLTEDGPKVIAYFANEDANKFILDDEVTLEKVQAFGNDFMEDKLKPFHKSDPIPEINDGDVKIIVANNFDEIVLDESKDVLLEIYAPWCGHCQSLEPTYNKLARQLRGVDTIVIAKMDGTTNEHPRVKSEAFPTILFFPAGNKSFNPINVVTDRTVVAFYKFLKKHASIPLKSQKPTSTQKIDTKDLKNEL